MKKYKELLYTSIVIDDAYGQIYFRLKKVYHGFYIYHIEYSDICYHKGFFNMSLEYSHWLDNHNKFRYRYYI